MMNHLKRVKFEEFKVPPILPFPIPKRSPSGPGGPTAEDEANLRAYQESARAHRAYADRIVTGTVIRTKDNRVLVVGDVNTELTAEEGGDPVCEFEDIVEIGHLW